MWLKRNSNADISMKEDQIQVHKWPPSPASLAWLCDLHLLQLLPGSLSTSTLSSCCSGTSGPLLPSLSGVFLLQATEAHSLIYSEYYPHAHILPDHSKTQKQHTQAPWLPVLSFFPRHITTGYCIICFLPSLWYELPKGGNFFYFTHCGIASA